MDGRCDTGGVNLVSRFDVDQHMQQREAMMQQGTHKVNPSEETIKVGPVLIRFLLREMADRPVRHG